MGLNKIMHKIKFATQCIMSNGTPLIHQVIANVKPLEIIYRGMYKAPKINPNAPLTEDHNKRFVLFFVIFDIMIVTINNINQI